MNIEKGVQKIAKALKFWKKCIVIGWCLLFLAMLVFINGNKENSFIIFNIAFILNMVSSLLIANIQMQTGTMLKEYKKIFSSIFTGLLGTFTLGIFAFVMANRMFSDKETINQLRKNWDEHIFNRMFFIK